MKIATAAEIREIDKATIEHYGLPGSALMENAGAAVAREVAAVLGGAGDKRICIFAGKGNNGGDGFVAARHLVNLGAKVKVFCLGEKASIAGDAKTYLNVLIQMNVDIMEITGERDWDKARIAATFADCLVDAMLGTGFRGELTEAYALMADIINRSGKRVVAIDIPSGIDADNGQVKGLAVKAHHTVTFGLPKAGLFLYPGAAFAGKVTVVDIGIPAPLLTSLNIKQNAVTAAMVRRMLPYRRPDAHKGINGRALVVAGSNGYTGAAALCASGAIRSGAGLVTLACAASIQPVLEMKLTEAMTKPLPEISGGAISLKAVPYLEELSDRCDVLAIGSGIGRHEETKAAVRELVRNAEKPLVIDADALIALAGHVDVVQQSDSLAVLTPHPGEMGALTGLTPVQVNQDRMGVARRAAHQWGSIIVLKGAPTVVAFPDGEVFVNTTGNAGMATGGSGDVLTGVIAGLIAQGLSSHDAAVAGVYIHGLAGDIAARSGMIGMAASDLLPAIPAAIFGLAGEDK